MKMVIPSFSNWYRMAQKSRRETGSTPLVGSSRKRIRGRCSRVHIRASFCFMPPESWAARRARKGSMRVMRKSSTAYIAVPTFPVTGQSPGAIGVIDLKTGAVTAAISCPPVNPTNPVCVWPGTAARGFNQPYQFLAMGNTGTRILAFSQGADSVANTIAVITPSSVGTQYPVVTFVPGFDHPVAAFFNSDDTAAYVLNCGAECGGQQASIQTLDLTTNTAGPAGVVCTPGGNPSCFWNF